MELLKQASERVIEINKLIRDVENNEKVLSDMKGLEVAMTDRNSTKYLTDVLTTEELEKVKNIIVNLVRVSGEESRVRLEKLIGVNKIEAKIVEAAAEPFTALVKDTEKQIEVKPVVKQAPKEEKKKEVGRPKVDIDYATVKEMYISKDMTVKDIAFKLGVNKNTLYAFIVNEGLRDLKKSQQTPSGFRG